MQNSRAILLLLIANSISGVSQGISILAVPWYFTGIINREDLFGPIYFVITAISLGWGLYAGTLIDRYSRKNIFLVINLAGLSILTVISGWGFANHTLPWFLVAAVFATTVFVYNIHFPNLYAFAQEITAKEDYARVTTLLEIQAQITYTTAGAMAAMLLSGFDGSFSLMGCRVLLPFSFSAWKIHEIFAIDAATYLIAFLIIYRIKSLPVVDKQIDRSGLRSRMKTGFSYLKKHPLLFNFGNASLLLFLTILIFSTYVMPVYVDSFLQRGGNVYGMADMFFSFGALLAGFLTTKIFAEKDAVQGIIILTLVSGLMYLAMLTSTQVALFFVCNFIIGACNSAVRIQRVTYLFHHIPNSVIGRAGSVFFVVNVFLRLCLIAVFALPFFHTGINILYAVAAMAAVCFIASAILLVNYKALMAEPETH